MAAIRKVTIHGPAVGRPRYGGEVKIEGLPELIAEMKGLGLRVNSNLRAAMRLGMKVIQTEAEMNARAITKHKATRIEATSRVQEGKVSVELHVAKKRFYLGFFETGVQPHEIKGSPLVFEGDKGLIVIGGVNHPGMPAQPWLRPAVDSKKDEAVGVIGDALRDVIEKRRAQLAGEEGEEGE